MSSHWARSGGRQGTDGGEDKRKPPKSSFDAEAGTDLAQNLNIDCALNRYIQNPRAGRVFFSSNNMLEQELYTHEKKSSKENEDAG